MIYQRRCKSFLKLLFRVFLHQFNNCMLESILVDNLNREETTA